MNGKTPDTVLLIVSPNFGVVDAWLPVLHALKARNPDVRIVALFAKGERIVSRADPADVLTALAQGMFDQVLYKSWYGRLQAAATLAEARARIARHAPPRGLSAGVDWLKRYPRGQAPAAGLERMARRWARYRRRREARVDLAALAGRVGAVCYDVSEEKGDLVREAQCVFGNAGWFSLPHGIDLRTYAGRFARLLDPSDGPRPALVVYLASELERPVYRAIAGTRASRLEVVGVPRHAPAWIAHLRGLGDAVVDSARPYIFLVSRPANERFFPLERKRQAVEDIRRLADEFEYDVIVRLHPKESDEAVYAPMMRRGATRMRWCVSNRHPFRLGARAAFSVAFFSSVAVDMVALGVPVIERCDFSGLTDTPQLVRDAAGRPASVYAAQGLVLSAVNFQELQAQVGRIRRDRAAVVKELQAAYAAVYAVHRDPIGTIAGDIEAALRGGAAS